MTKMQNTQIFRVSGSTESLCLNAVRIRIECVKSVNLALQFCSNTMPYHTIRAAMV